MEAVKTSDKWLETAKNMGLHTNPDVILNGLFMLSVCDSGEIAPIVEAMAKEMDSKNAYFMALSKAVIRHYLTHYIGGSKDD